ncbi:MAG TPA: sigma-70 family RNA polymerase sigma factor [Gaiellaceae bacterium]
MRHTQRTSSGPGARLGSILSVRTPDQQLAKRLAAGDDAAFDLLYRRYSARLAAYGARLLADRAKGEDVAQTALMNAYRALRHGRSAPPTHVKAWLYRIAERVALQLLQREKDVAAELEPESAGPDPQEASAARGQLVAALRELPERQLHAFLLRELRGFSVAEIGAALQLTSEQVEQALFAARNRLAEGLVFGRRLDCASVQALDGAVLDLSERRALQAHLRACPCCRSSLELGKKGLGGISPLGLLAWLRDAAAGMLSSGGAPVAAKVGVAVASVALAGGGVVAAETVAAQARESVAADRPTAAARTNEALAAAAVPGSARRGMLGLGPVLAVAPASQPQSAPASTVTTAPGQTDSQSTDTQTAPAPDPATDTSTDPSPSDSAPTDTFTDATSTDASTDPTPPSDSVPSDPAATDPTATATDTVSTDTAPTDTVSTDTTSTDTTSAATPAP